MKNYRSSATQGQLPVGQLKESIRDMVQLQRDYKIPDELFWEIFNARVLLNEQIDVTDFIRNRSGSSARA